MSFVDRCVGCFPFDEFREYQEETLLDTATALDEGADVVLMRRDVGFGKSPVAIALCAASGGAYYMTPQIMLQEQLNRDFSDCISVIYGRNNYQCLANGKTAKYGECQVNTKYDCGKPCPYKIARQEASDAHTACMNVAYGIYAPIFYFEERELLVIDECHTLPDWGINFVTATIRADIVDSRIPNYKEFGDYIEWLDSIASGAKDEAKHLQERLTSGDDSLGLIERRDIMNEMAEKVSFLVGDYAETEEDWVWERTDIGTKNERVQFKPVTCGRFLDSLLFDKAEKVVMMSGTIVDPELFLSECGLQNKKHVLLRDIPSPFPVENRQIIYKPIGKMSVATKHLTLPKIVDFIRMLKIKHTGEKGLIHAHSYENARFIYEHIGMDFLGEFVLQDRQNRDASLNQWMEDPTPTVFISVNRTEGLDLKDDLCRWQVIMKVPYGYVGDKQIKARFAFKRFTCFDCGADFRGTSKKCPECDSINTITTNNNEGGDWYDAKAVETIVQSVGRVVRSKDDFGTTYIVDESFGWLYKKQQRLFPASFKEALVKV